MAVQLIFLHFRLIDLSKGYQELSLRRYKNKIKRSKINEEERGLRFCHRENRNATHMDHGVANF